MFEQELEQRQRDHQLRTLRVIGSPQGPSVSLDGRPVLLFCSNDYLGLAAHPALVKAANDTMEQYGFGAGASRLVSGNMTPHEELEAKIASFKGTESAVLFNSGYAANTGILPAIAGAGDVIFSDELNHASIIDGCRLSKGRTVVYRHCDLDHLDQQLRKHDFARRKIIVTDGVFSMDGDIAPLPGLVDLAERYDALLMVDDAHATGVLGKSGKGTIEHFNLAGRVPIQVGTLGKALGSFGAYAAGDRGLIRFLLNTCRSYIFSTALPPGVCAASLTALSIIEQEPWRRERLWLNRHRFAAGIAALGLDTGRTETPIIPIIIGNAEAALAAGNRLLELGLYAPAIRPPSVRPGSARIRATVMATHTDEQIDHAIKMVAMLKETGSLA